jgi:hypothetical protein
MCWFTGTDQEQALCMNSQSLCTLQVPVPSPWCLCPRMHVRLMEGRQILTRKTRSNRPWCAPWTPRCGLQRSNHAPNLGAKAWKRPDGSSWMCCKSVKGQDYDTDGCYWRQRSSSINWSEIPICGSRSRDSLYQLKNSLTLNLWPRHHSLQRTK